MRWLTLALFVVAACQSKPVAEDAVAQAPAGIREGGSEQPKKLVLGLAPFLSEEDMRREYSALGAYLGAATGLPVELKLADTYAGLSAMLSRFEIHLAILPPLAYVQAKRDNPSIVLLATEIVDGSSTYAAYIVTRDDSGIDNIEQLAGKRFAFVDRSSASGYLYPLAYLRSLGVEPATFFGNVEFTGDHNRLIDLVLSRKIDAGATFSTAFKMASVEHAEGKRLKILAKTGRIPLDAVCASPRLDDALIGKARAALLGLSTRNEEGRRVLRGLTSINGFVQVGDDHYDEVRRVARLLEASP